MQFVYKQITAKHTYGDSMTKEEKEKFRKTNKWKAFRKKIREHTPKDYITRKELTRTWNLHHLDLRSENYTDLSNIKKFLPLNKDTHEFIHWLFRIYRHDKSVLQRIQKVMEEMYEYVK